MTSTWTFRGVKTAVVVTGLSLAGVLLAGRADAQSTSAATGDYLFRTY